MSKTTHLFPLHLRSKPHQCSYDPHTHTYLNVENFFICHLFIVSLINDWGSLKNGAAGPRSKPHIPPFGSETLGFGQKHDATVDIPLDTMNVVKLLFPFLFLFLVFDIFERAELCSWWYGFCRILRAKRKSLHLGKQISKGGKRFALQFHDWVLV